MSLNLHRGTIVLLGVVIVAGLLTWLFRTLDKILDEFARVVQSQAGKKDATLTDEQQVRLQWHARRLAKEERKAPDLN